MRKHFIRILPGDRVDVLMTREIKNNDSSAGPRFTTATIMRNMKVLAIYQTTRNYGTVLENVVLDASGTPDLNDGSLTENTRSAYPIDQIANIQPGSVGGIPKNVVFLTADVHYTAAISYEPDRAGFKDFAPFWEFVSGPLHAGTFGPNDLDATFGPELMFVKAPAPGQVNLPPSAGMQFFGHVKIDGKSGQMTVSLRDRVDAELWAITLDPKPV